jgi:hypothetical protein
MGPVAKFLVDAAQSPFVQLCIFISGAIWIGVAAVISSRRTGSNFAAVTFDDAIIVPSGHGDGIQPIVHHPTSDVTAKLLPEPKQGAPVLVEIVNKSDTVARLHTARLLGINGNGNEELLLGPRHIIGIHEWKPVPFVMDPKSRITIAFVGMCLRMLPDKFTAYLVEVELEDETKIRTDKRIKFASVIQPEKDSRRLG